MATATKTIDWDFIVDTIEAEKCILFVGPELFGLQNSKPLWEQIAEYVEVKKNSEILNYYEEEDLFLFSSAGAKTKTYYKIKNFFSEELPNIEDLIGKIAKIPFHMIISVTPDNIFPDTFDKLGFQYRKDFYWKNQKPNPISSPNKEHPLIYNLLGNIEQEESLILTHDDLYDYFKSILGARGLPDELKAAFANAHNYLFLGLDLGKWYMQLLLRLLNLTDEKYKFARYASNQKINDQVKIFCIDQFRIEFVQHNIEKSIEEIYKRCEKKELLRTAGEQTGSVSERVLQFISEDKIDPAIEQLLQFLAGLGDTGQDLADDLTLLSSRYKRLKRKINQGVLAESESEIESNKVRKALLDLANEAKALE